jgi:hypothetical protein
VSEGPARITETNTHDNLSEEESARTANKPGDMITDLETGGGLSSLGSAPFRTHKRQKQVSGQEGKDETFPVGNPRFVAKRQTFRVISRRISCKNVCGRPAVRPVAFPEELLSDRAKSTGEPTTTVTSDNCSAVLWQLPARMHPRQFN